MKKKSLLTQSGYFQPARRNFIRQSVLLGSSILVYGSCIREEETMPFSGEQIPVKGLLGGLRQVKGPDYIKSAQWYEGDRIQDGISFVFPAGMLKDQNYITTDMIADGNHTIKFMIILQEGEDGRAFQFRFGVLNQCSLRVRMPLSLVDQNRWGIDREGAFLKPRCSGDRVDLEKVDRMRLVIHKKSDQIARFCMTPAMVSAEEVPLIEHPMLPEGHLIDDIGQSTIHEWPGKTQDLEQMKIKLQKRYQATDHVWPSHFSKWGGWKKKRLDDGNGFFRVHHDADRWWLIDPDGYYFWSAGIDCIRVDTSANYYLLADSLAWIPGKEGEFADIFSENSGFPHINYLAANYIRTFGVDGWREKWARIALDELKRLRCNTVGNWSEWEYAREAGFPYVRPMSFAPSRVSQIYRDFPDVYHTDFEKDALEYAQVLDETRNDPALIGYFMMNEPKWAFSSELPAVGMLYNTEACETRKALKDFLKNKYSDDQTFSSNWDLDGGLSVIESGRWTKGFSDKALEDLENFSQIMVEKYFTALSQACRRVDPNHLNLGIRYAGVPPSWAVKGMQSFDVFSMNCYMEKVPFDQTEKIHALLNMPVIIGEWHFGALDVGLPSSGIGHVRTQADRGKAYRIYIEDAAANPYCIGTHWFTLYDQSALGRFDGENYQIGFLDICNMPHDPICEAAILSHENIYDIASGDRAPFNDAPEYLPKLF